MLNWLRRLMYGRYGSDQLNNGFLVLCVLLMLLQMLVRWTPMTYIVMALLLLSYIRMFSRNIPARYAENQKFLSVWSPISRKFKTKQTQFKDRKIHRYLKCANCKTTLRVPRGKGRIEVTCPNCKNQFFTKS